ncbi:MAG: HAD family hydrolase [Akkermansiaceae bacterium]|nr:HAD family hydrolase [Akkermansiaceae bacterium]
MKIAIVHHHLGAGGVSEVIAGISRGLSATGLRHVVLVDDPVADAAPGIPLCKVAGLGYGGAGEGGLLERVSAAARDALGGPPDLWHFHNHSLGKSADYAALVPALAQRGERMLLHIHDLAEDGRPENAAALRDIGGLYPIGPGIGYAFLNRRDLRDFTAAGVPAENAWLLRTPVTVVPRSSVSGPPLLLAPVRGIRRKNLGEILLLAALAPDNARFAITRAPANGRWLARHDFWHRAAVEFGLPVSFDVVNRRAPAPGADPGFDSWLAHASHLVTTSIAEGFGRVFVEAPAAAKPLIGRSLPDIADDLRNAGIEHRHLYQKILVPSDLLDRGSLRAMLRASLEETRRDWGLRTSGSDVDVAFEAMESGGRLDFGNLPEEAQQEVLRRIVRDDLAGEVRVICEQGITSAADWLADAILEPLIPNFDPAAWSPEAVANECIAIYQKLASTERSVVSHADRTSILSAHLAPAAFHFLKARDVGTRPAPRLEEFGAVVFDIYGTLLDAPAGGVNPDPAMDVKVAGVIRSFGYDAPRHPTDEIWRRVRHAHETSEHPHPEVDLRELWADVLGIDRRSDLAPLVTAIEREWHPATWIDGARETLERLAELGTPIGVLSNAQCNTLTSMGRHAGVLAPNLSILSYQHRIAKPAPELFALLARRLDQAGVPPENTLFIGNDPLQDIAPARAAGFATALFTGHPASFRPGFGFPDFEIRSWLETSVSNPATD